MKISTILMVELSEGYCLDGLCFYVMQSWFQLYFYSFGFVSG